MHLSYTFSYLPRTVVVLGKGHGLHEGFTTDGALCAVQANRCAACTANCFAACFGQVRKQRHQQLPEVMVQASQPRAHASWSPYDDNGGTCLAVAGNDYCIIAASTRMSTGFSILTRDASKILKLSDRVVIASAGMQADARTLQKLLQVRNVTYQHTHQKAMGVTAMAQLLSNTLYYKRFFPYYTFNICAGLDNDGRGAVYSYDAIGSYERTGYACQGSGKDLIQPVLDNQLKASSPLVLPAENWMSSLPLDQAVDLVKDAFVSAGERDIYTGDEVEILIMTKEGCKHELLPLKKD